MAKLMPREALNGLVAHLDEVQAGLRKEAEEVETRANTNLVAARASTSHRKIASKRAHMTEIGMGHTEGKYGSIDYEVYMEGDDPMAEEFGHAPSGYFAPDKGRPSRAPSGLYILTGAAGFDRLQHVSSGKKRGKR